MLLNVLSHIYLIPCLDRGSITPAEIILLPFTKTAPSCNGVSVANRFIKDQ